MKKYIEAIDRAKGNLGKFLDIIEDEELDVIEMTRYLVEGALEINLEKFEHKIEYIKTDGEKVHFRITSTQKTKHKEIVTTYLFFIIKSDDSDEYSLHQKLFVNVNITRTNEEEPFISKVVIVNPFTETYGRACFYKSMFDITDKDMLNMVEDNLKVFYMLIHTLRENFKVIRDDEIKSLSHKIISTKIMDVFDEPVLRVHLRSSIDEEERFKIIFIFRPDFEDGKIKINLISVKRLGPNDI